MPRNVRVKRRYFPYHVPITSNRLGPDPYAGGRRFALPPYGNGVDMKSYTKSMGSDSIDLELLGLSIPAPCRRLNPPVQLPLDALLEAIAAQHPSFIRGVPNLRNAGLRQMMPE